MKLRWIVAAGTVVGIALAARRRGSRPLTEGDRWSATTDPVTPLGDA